MLRQSTAPRYNSMYLLADWEDLTGKYLARGHGVRPDLTQSISILSYGRPVFSFNLLSFIFFPWEGQRLFSFARIFE